MHHYNSLNKEQAIKGKVEVVLDQVRPALHPDGDDVELVDVNEGVIRQQEQLRKFTTLI